MKKYIPLIIKSSVKSFEDIASVLTVDGGDIYELMLQLNIEEYDKASVEKFTADFIYHYSLQEHVDERVQKLINHFFNINQKFTFHHCSIANINLTKENQKILLKRNPQIILTQVIQYALYNKFDKKIFNEALLKVSSKEECTAILTGLIDKLAILYPDVQQHLMNNFKPSEHFHISVKTKKIWKALKEISKFIPNYHYQSLEQTITRYQITESGIKYLFTDESAEVVEEFKDYYKSFSKNYIRPHILEFLSNFNILKEKQKLHAQLATNGSHEEKHAFKI